MKQFHFYDEKTGLIHHKTVFVNAPVDQLEAVAEANAPAGHAPIEGVHDRECRRVHVQSRTVVDYQPPQPSPDHEWNSEARRWHKRADARAREERRAAALARIDVLEAKLLRALREAALGYDGAKQRLQDIDEEIIQLRAALT